MTDATPSSTVSLPPGAEAHAHRFKKSLPAQMIVHETLRSLGSTEGQSCLDIGAPSGMMSYHLRRRGGHWHTAAATEALAASIRRWPPGVFQATRSPASTQR